MKTDMITDRNSNEENSLDIGARSILFNAFGFNGRKQMLGSLILTVAMMLPFQALAAGPAAVNLGTASHFAVLAGSQITSTGGGFITGDIGLSPATGASIGITTAQVNGVIYAVNAAGPAGSIMDPGLLTVAKSDLTTAYNDAAARVVPDAVDPGAGDIGGLTLAPGLYKFTSAALISSDLTLSGGPNDVWIFQIDTALTVGNGINVILTGGAQAKNVFWQVGSSAFLGTSTSFKGTIMADQSITMPSTSTLEGRALARIAQVTFDGTSITLVQDEYSLTKTVVSPTNGVARVGDSLVFQITIANTGSVTMATVPVEDHYSTSILSYVGAVPATVDNTDDGIVNWANVGPLAPGASTNLLVTFTAVGSTAGQLATNLVIAAPTGMTVKTNTATYSTSLPGFSVAKTVTTPASGAALVGDPVVFQITVVNTGDVTLATIPVEDLYSTGSLSFVGALPATVDNTDDGILNWANIGSLATGATATISVTFTAVGSTFGLSATNWVVASSPGMPPQTNSATYGTSGSAYTVSKMVLSPTNGIVPVGTIVVFQVTVANTGDSPLTAVPVQDLYLTNILAFVGSTPATVDNINDGMLNWADVGPLAPGVSTNILVTFTAVGSTAGQLTTNVVVASPASMPVKTNMVTFSTIAPAFAVTKTVTTPLSGIAQVGAPVIFQITVANTGDVTLVTIPVADLYLTGSLTFTTANPSTMDAINDGMLNWTNVGPLAPGASTNLIVSFTAAGSTGGYAATNRVVVSPANIPAQTNRALYRVNATATPVTLKSFGAGYFGQNVIVSWETGMELDNLGFNVYCATSETGPRVKLNSGLIAGMGTSQGRPYEWCDTVPDATQAHYYWLEDVSWKFETKMHGPVYVRAANVVIQNPLGVNAVANFSLTTGGLYRISWDAMKAAGLPVVTMDPSQIQILIQGQQVAAYVSAGATTLSEGDYILFYASSAADLCAIGMGTNALRVELISARPSRATGDVWAEIVGPDQQVSFVVSTNYIRYILADFEKTPVWVLDISDPVKTKLMYGFSYARVANGLSAVYLSYPSAASEPATCKAIGETAIIEVPVISKTP